MCKVLNLHYGPIFRSQISNEMSFNIRHQLPSSAVQYPRRTEISFFKFLGGSFDTAKLSFNHVLKVAAV